MAQTYDLKGQGGIQVWSSLPEGVTLTLLNGAKGVVTANPQDGGYIMVKWVEHPNGDAKVGEEELVFFNEVASASD